MLKNFYLKYVSKHFSWSLFFIIICAFFVRTAFLNNAPIGLTNDEVTFVINAKAVALTGMDVSGRWSPFSLTPIPYGFPMSELSYLLVSPTMGILASSLSSARIPYALYSVLLVIVLYFIAYKLFGKKEAIAVGLVAAFNPWGIMFGRTAFDFPLAIFFYMLAFLLILYLRNWKIILVFIPLFLAFFTYIATKIIFVPFVIIISYFGWVLNKKQYFKYYALLCCACIFLTGVFIFSLKTQSTGQRLTEIETPFSSVISKGVDRERKLSIQTPLNPILSNKVIFFIKDISQKYVDFFSPNYMFFTGDSDMHLSLWIHGYFYYLDLIFLILGYYVLFQKNKKNWLLFTFLMLIAPFPAVLHTGGLTTVTRGALIFPMFMILVGIGITYFIQLFRKKMQVFVILILGLLYLLLFINFLNIYLFRLPIYNSEGSDFNARLLSKYVLLTAQNKKVDVYTREPEVFYKHYLFYTNSYNKENSNKIAQYFRDQNYTFDNVVVKTGCPSNLDLIGDKTIIISESSDCKNMLILKMSFLSISQLKDGGFVYRIYNDKLCSKYHLPQFISGLSLSNLNIEKLSEENFCKTFIVKY